MNEFSLSRFGRVFQNDVLRVAKPLVLGTLALLGLTVIVYLSNFEPNDAVPENPAYVLMFAFYLFGGGLLLASSAFQDMHHPLERYQYLMLPMSNLERFLSRYLLTGPAFVVFLCVAFTAMDWTGNFVTDLWKGASQPRFSVLNETVIVCLKVYLFVHVVVLIGAICCRSFTLLRTALFLLAAMVGLVLVSYLAVRLFYFDAFSWTRLNPVGDLHMRLQPLFAATWLNVTVAIGFTLWLLYVAYRCLCSHEVQDEL
jgi:hypothetical protein